MANIVPWLLSMSLLGVQNFTPQSGVHALEGQLDAPHQGSLIPTFSGFPSSLRNYKKLISSHDELPGHITCETSHKDNLVDKLPTTPLYSNHLYGSTPEIPERIFGSHSRHGIFGRPGGRRVNFFNTDPFSVNQLDSSGFPPVLGQGQAEDDYVGPAMELVYAWSTVDFEYDSIEARDAAVYSGDYVAENNMPLGIEVWRNKVFITLPKWKDGIPATLTTVPRLSNTKSPKLTPYPNWEWQKSGDCQHLTSVFRVQVDECDRLWVMDTGVVNLSSTTKQQCPPSLFIFDLNTDTLIRRYPFPADHIKEDSLYSNIVVDIRNEDCGSAVAYMSDVWRFGIVVYNFTNNTSFRTEHPYFYPDPLATKYDIHGTKFQWLDGIFGISLSPVDIHDDRTLFFHPLSSFREFAVSTSVLRDAKTATDNADKFIPIGRPRAKDYGHSSGSVIDRNGVMFFNMVTRDSVWCWDTRKEYIPQNLGVIGTSNISLVFPNDIRVDHEYDQNVWVTSNKLPFYLFGKLDSGKINYRVLKANVKEAVKNTVCDPEYIVPDVDQGYDETC